MCGENPIESTFGAKVLGSPPHVRGKPSYCPPCCLHDGITPACAGKTGLGVGCYGKHRDHPRMCGENA